jgi:hypothetical protein
MHCFCAVRFWLSRTPQCGTRSAHAHAKRAHTQEHTSSHARNRTGRRCSRATPKCSASPHASRGVRVLLLFGRANILRNGEYLLAPCPSRCSGPVFRFRLTLEELRGPNSILTLRGSICMLLLLAYRPLVEHQLVAPTQFALKCCSRQIGDRDTCPPPTRSRHGSNTTLTRPPPAAHGPDAQRSQSRAILLH